MQASICQIHPKLPNLKGFAQPWDARRYKFRQHASVSREFLMTNVWSITHVGFGCLYFRHHLEHTPGKSGRAYDKIWDQKPTTARFAYFQKSGGNRHSMGEDIVVDYAFRYGNPSTKDALARMKEAGVDRIVTLALYPQYSTATTATGYDAVFNELKKMKWQPSLITLPPYHDHADYVDALAKSVDAKLAEISWEPDMIVTSYHGVPERYLHEGDPYHCHCYKTTRLLGEARPSLPATKGNVCAGLD